MREFRKKQKLIYGIMKTVIIFSAIFIFVYIGIQPSVAQYSNVLAIICSYICDALVITIMFFVFFYYSKYGKCDAFLERIEYEISDYGYYLTSRTDNDTESYSDAIYEDLKECKYIINKNIEIDEFDFFARAYKSKEFFYIINVDDLDKNDILAYSDVAVNDLTVRNLKRKGDCVICFVTNKASDDAIEISKVITGLGRKEQLKISYAIAEVDTKRVYFLGNKVSKLQQMTANFVMNCEVPIKDEYKGEKHLSYQDKLEERMKNFNIKEFKNGTFYAH